MHIYVYTNHTRRIHNGRLYIYIQFTCRIRLKILYLLYGIQTFRSPKTRAILFSFVYLRLTYNAKPLDNGNACVTYVILHYYKRTIFYAFESDVQARIWIYFACLSFYIMCRRKASPNWFSASALTSEMASDCQNACYTLHLWSPCGHIWHLQTFLVFRYTCVIIQMQRLEMKVKYLSCTLALLKKILGTFMLL